VPVDAPDARPVGGCLNRRYARSEFLFTDRPGDIGVPQRVVGRQVNLVAQENGRAVVLAEEDSDGIEVVVVGLDVPVTVDAPAQACPADASATVGTSSMRSTRWSPTTPASPPSIRWSWTTATGTA
jgi:hypothetical protein